MNGRTLSWRSCFAAAAVVAAGLLLSACAAPAQPGSKGQLPGRPRVQGAEFHDPLSAVVHDQPISFSVAKNETIGFALHVSEVLEDSDRRIQTLRITTPTLNSTSESIEPGNFTAWQVLPMPIDVNRAGACAAKR